MSNEKKKVGSNIALSDLTARKDVKGGGPGKGKGKGKGSGLPFQGGSGSNEKSGRGDESDNP